MILLDFVVGIGVILIVVVLIAVFADIAQSISGFFTDHYVPWRSKLMIIGIGVAFVVIVTAIGAGAEALLQAAG